MSGIRGVIFLAFALLSHGMKPGLLEDEVISAIVARVGKTPAQVLLAWAVHRGTTLLRLKLRLGRERISTSPLSQKTRSTKSIASRQRLNPVVDTGVPA